MVTEHHSPRADKVDLSGDELRQAPLDGLAVDVPAPGALPVKLPALQQITDVACQVIEAFD